MIANAEPAPSPEMKLAELVDLYATTNSLSPDSRTLYHVVAKSFAKSIDHSATAADLTTTNVDRWFAEIKNRLASTSACYYGKRIRTLWRFAFAHRLTIEQPPARAYMRVSETEKHKRERKEERLRKPKTARNYPFNSTDKLAAVHVVRPGSIVPTRQTTLREYYDAIYCPMRLGIRSPRTKVLYLNTLGQFDKYLTRSARLADLNDETVTGHLVWILESGRQPRTANKSRDQLLALWRYAARKKHVDLWPDVEQIPEYKRAPRAWTIDQLARLIDVARKQQPPGLREETLCGVPHKVWWPSLFLLLYDTGIRIGAAMQLRCGDFDSGSRVLFVRAETQKQRADQALPVSEETALALETLIASKHREMLFPWPYVQWYFYKHLKWLLTAAGLPSGRSDKFHKIRRTSATMAEKYVGPGAATVHLGHSSPKVTERYLDRTMLPIANVAAALPRPIMPKPAHGKKGGAA